MTKSRFSNPLEKALAPPKRLKINEKVKLAIDLLASGEARHVQAAADALRCDRGWLATQLKKSHVRDYAIGIARGELSGALTRAARVKVELLSSDETPAKVRSEIASEILALEGITASKRDTAVNVNVQAGYIVRLDDGAPPIELTAEPIEEDEKHAVERLIRDLG